MPLNVVKKEIEVEREIGYKYLQVLGRAETLVPGAGREAIEVLLWDASAAVIRADVQSDRVVLDGTLSCQAVYRQGEECTLRALSAKSTLSQVTEMPGAQGGMLSRVQPVVESVDARYENGHMVFQVGLGLHVRVMKLEPVEVIDALEGAEGVETRYAELPLTKLAAEATETAVLTDRVELPASLDARATLMDWGSVAVDSCEPDLGGMRVKGRTLIEALIASGIEGRPGVVVKYPIEFDKLIELPEWLCQGAGVTPSIRSIRTQLEPPEGEDEGALMIQADVHFSIVANLSEKAKALEDAYGVSGSAVEVERRTLNICTGAVCRRVCDTVRGTVLLEEGASAVGNVIAVRVLPNIAEIRSENGRSRISGLLDTTVLYMPGTSDKPASARTSLPFEMELPGELNDTAAVCLSIVSAEANALMSDRLEMKIGLCADCEAREETEFSVAGDVTEAEAAPRKHGYVICWPTAGEDAWAIGKRYGVPESDVEESAGEGVAQGQPVVLRV